MTAFPPALQRELDAFGVRLPTAQERLDARHPPQDPWWKRGEECPH
jgi:hypothetical protein